MGIQFDGINNEIKSQTKIDFPGSIGIAGTLTYEDVTSVDSIGIITARTGVIVGSGVTLNATGVIATGVVTATSFSGSGANLTSLPSQLTLSNNANNRVITGGSGVNLNGEAALTFDGNNFNFSRQDAGDARMYIYGGEGGDARLLLASDEGDDHIDTWEIRSQASDNNLAIYQFGGGSYNKRLTIDTDANNGDVIVNTGNLVIGTSGKGIDFSATPNGYSGTLQETLDDYEEGYWTPTVGGWSASGTGVYGTGGQKGRYTKIGNTVTVFFHIYWTALNNASGVFAIESLPFPHASNQYYFSTAVQMRYVDYSGDTVFAIGGHDYSSSLLFYAQNDNGNHSYVPIDSNGGRVEGCVTYLTDS